MKPNRIILVRHGESVGNKDWTNFKHTPDYRLELTDLGVDQATNAGKEIAAIIGTESVYAYVSPYLRTRRTFDQIKTIIGNNIRRSIEDPRIREQDWGHLKSIDEGEKISSERNSFGTFFYRIPSGESGADVFDRISTFLETLHRDFSKNSYPDNCLIVTHGLTLRLFLMRWFHWSYEEFEQLVNPGNCKVVVMCKNSEGKYVPPNTNDNWS
jgi:broad specificity phosphatase PhoE